jgi:hypothetical protein
MCEAKNERFDGSAYEFMCEVCDTHVLNSAKHCGACNRCVDKFDHHCKWINNCVGRANYRHFFRLIIAAFTMTLMHNLTNAFVIALVYHDDPAARSQNELVFGAVDLRNTVGVLWVALFFNLLCFGFLGHLILYHIRLQRLKLTTFEYIKLTQKRRESKVVVRKEKSVKSQEAQQYLEIELKNSNTQSQQTDRSAETVVEQPQLSPLKQLWLKLKKVSKIGLRQTALVAQRENTIPDNTEAAQSKHDFEETSTVQIRAVEQHVAQGQKRNLDIYNIESPVVTAKMTAVIKLGTGDDQSHVAPPRQLLPALTSEQDIEQKQFAFSLRNADKHRMSQTAFSKSTTQEPQNQEGLNQRKSSITQSNWQKEQLSQAEAQIVSSKHLSSH